MNAPWSNTTAGELAGPATSYASSPPGTANRAACGGSVTIRARRVMTRTMR